MQTRALLILAALGSSALAVAQSTTPAASPAATAPRFDASEKAPELLGYDDAVALYEVKFGAEARNESEQLARWLDELKAGRARAGTLAGSYLTYRALTASDCAAARDVLLQADELGSDQAPWALAQLAENTSCGEVDRAALEKWLKKAVTLDYFIALRRLMDFYAASEDPRAAVQKYTYARIAAGYWQAVSEGKADERTRAGFDPAALQEMEKPLSAADRKLAETDSARILAEMLKRHGRFGVVPPVEFSRGGAGAKGEFVAYSVDYRHECQWNLKGNCRGAQRIVFADLTNNNAEFLACKLELRARDLVKGVVEPQIREVLIGPKVKRRLLFADVNEQPDKKGMVASCAPVAKLAANAAAGKCRARLQGSVDVQKFYPEAARRNGKEGSVVVRYWVPSGSEVSTDEEIAVSSGDESLDVAAISTVRSGKFARDCDYGLSTIKIIFKLGE